MKRFSDRITPFVQAIGRFFFQISNDLLVLSGVIVIVWTNFQVHILFGWYSVGVSLVLFGLGLTRIIRRKPQK